VVLSTALSAGVAGLVALVADYFAWPGLEDREERILERHRARRSFEAQLRKIQMVASATCSRPNVGALSDGNAALLEAEIHRRREGVVDARGDGTCQDGNDRLLPMGPRRARKSGVWVAASTARGIPRAGRLSGPEFERVRCRPEPDSQLDMHLDRPGHI